MASLNNIAFSLLNKVPARVFQPVALSRNGFDSLLDGLWAQPIGRNLSRQFRALSSPALEFKDKQDHFELVAEIPGIDANDLDVKVSDGTLILSGERRESVDDKSNGISFSERRYGRFERSIELPTGIDYDKITAKAKDGILTVELPKNPAAIEHVRKIPINA